jgi:TadE-like protein
MHKPLNSMRFSRGQSLVETALVVPLLVLLVLNVVNFGYFFLVMVNLTGAARTSTLYAIEGSATPVPGGAIASSGGASPTTNKSSVTYLIYQDLTGALWNPTGVTVQVCSQANITASGSGVNTTNGALRTNCELCDSSGCGSPAANAAGFPVPSADPEAPLFVLNRVDIQYDFPTLIPGTIFNLPLQASGMCNSGSCTFYRHAEMRAMN